MATALLAASAATAIFQGTFLTSAARTGAAVATAVTFGIAPVSPIAAGTLLLLGGLIVVVSARPFEGGSLKGAPQGWKLVRRIPWISRIVRA